MQPMEDIYREYAQVVYRYLVSLTHSSDIAEELTQETFYQAIRTSDRYDETCKITTWLCSIAKNVLITYRRKHPESEDISDKEIPTVSAEHDALNNIQRIELMKKIHLLEDPYREVIYLRVFGELSFKEIGEVLSKNENWARVTYYRGKERLGKEVSKDE